MTGSERPLGLAAPSGLLRRALRRHWGKIALSWLLASSGVVLLADRLPDLAPALVSRRATLLVAAPAALLVVAVGTFALIEARSRLVRDPAALAERVGLPIIGLIPPIPQLRFDDSDESRLEPFVGGLDYLRLALRAGLVPGDRGRRCFLVTSAVAGEGKTTLAAHLASRSASAGLRTLLIDADLRRASLGRLLDLPPGKGLGDLLAGEAAPDDATILAEFAGGARALRAGTPGIDPGLLLESPRLGELLAGFRERFDLILIDSPPVLPVADAALIGRWVDGAMLVARADASRVDRVADARRRLIYLGVPVIGAVVNGVRPSEASSPSYGYEARSR